MWSIFVLATIVDNLYTFFFYVIAGNKYEYVLIVKFICKTEWKTID